MIIQIIINLLLFAQSHTSYLQYTLLFRSIAVTIISILHPSTRVVLFRRRRQHCVCLELAFVEESVINTSLITMQLHLHCGELCVRHSVFRLPPTLIPRMFLLYASAASVAESSSTYRYSSKQKWHTVVYDNNNMYTTFESPVANLIRCTVYSATNTSGAISTTPLLFIPVSSARSALQCASTRRGRHSGNDVDDSRANTSPTACRVDGIRWTLTRDQKPELSPL